MLASYVYNRVYRGGKLVVFMSWTRYGAIFNAAWESDGMCLQHRHASVHPVQKVLKPTYRRLLLRCWHHLSSAARPGKQNLLFSRSIAETGLRRKRCGDRGPSAGSTRLGTPRCRYSSGGPAGPTGASGLSQARDAGGCYLTNPSELS